MLRALRLIAGFTVGVLGTLSILALILFWRLEQAPYYASDLTSDFEMALAQKLPGQAVHIDHSMLTWDNTKRTISLHLDGVKLSDKNGITTGELGDIDFVTTFSDILTRKFIPRALTAHHVFVRLTHSDDGQFYFGALTGGAVPAKSETLSEQAVRDYVQKLLSRLARGDIARKHEIDDIRIEIDDKNAEQLFTVSLPVFILDNASSGLEGHAQIQLQKGDQSTSGDLSYRFEHAKKNHQLNLHLNSFNPSLYMPVFLPIADMSFSHLVDMPLTADIKVDIDSHLDLEAVNIDLTGADGSLNYQPFWQQRRTVATLALKADYHHKDHKLHGTASLDFGGAKVESVFDGTPSPLTSRQIDIVFGVKLANWPMDQYGQLWPKAVIPDTYDWISKNLSKGMFESGEGTFKGKLPLDHIDDFDITEGSGVVTASGAQVTYVDGMPAVAGVNAKAEFDLSQVTAHVESGTVANLKLLPFDIRLTDLDAHVQNIDIPIHMTGQIPDVMALIDSPPLGYITSMGMKPTDIQGTVAAIVDLKFPLLESLAMKDVDIKAKGDLSNVSALQLIPGIPLDKGNLALDLDKERVILTGPLTVDNLPMQGTYRHNFKEGEGKPIREGELTGNLVDDQWVAFGQDALKGSRGNVGLVVDFTEPSKGLFLINASADLTNADIVVDPMNWKKPLGTATNLKISAEFPADKPVNIKSIDLRSFNTHVEGSATLDNSGDRVQLLRLDLPSFVMGRSNLSAHFNQLKNSQHTLVFRAEGPALDVSGFKNNGDAATKDTRPKEFHIKIGKLYTSDNGFITKAEGHAQRDSGGWNEINLQGLAQGNHRLDISLLPKDGRRILKITSPNFGEMLQGFGITNTIKEGTLDIAGESSAEQPRVITGKIKIGKFVVTNLPVLAVLINATMPFGFTDILNRSATFDKLTSRFKWDGDKIELTKMNAAGNSIGINAEGTIDTSSNKANLRGTLVPFSIVNRVIGAIPLIGNMFTGGQGQGVLAVAYKVTGPLDNPNVSVNPISLLTPGFVRNLFFGGSDEQSDATDTKPAEPTDGPVIHSPNSGGNQPEPVDTVAPPAAN